MCSKGSLKILKGFRKEKVMKVLRGTIKNDKNEL